MPKQNVKWIKDYETSSDIVTRRKESGEFLIVGLNDDDHYFSIDGIAADVWEGLEKKEKLDKILAKLKKKYPKDDVEKDVEKFIKSLIKNKLIS